MRLFRPKEGDESENKRVQSQIKEPEKPTIEAKDKLNQSERDKFLERIKCKPNESTGDNSEKGKLNPKSDAPYKEEREKQLGKGMER